MIKLDNFPIRKQQTPYSCGYTAISMICTFFGNLIKEEEIPKGFLFKIAKGLHPSQFGRILKKYLPNYSMNIITPPEEEIPEIILRQIKKGCPIPILFSTRNDFEKHNIVLHYSVVIGIEKNKTKVSIANPFGYEEVLEIEDLLDRMAYRNFTERPFIIRVALLLGLLKKNTMLKIQKST